MQKQTEIVPSKQINILQLQQQKQVQHLIFLFDHKIIDQFISSCEQLQDHKISLKQLSIKYKLEINLFNTYVDFKKILEQSQKDLQIARSPNEGWSVVKIDERSQMALKIEGTVVTIKANGIFPTRMRNIAIMAYLVKLYTQCIPFCHSGEDLKQITRLEKIAYLYFKLPIIKDRYVFIRGMGLDRRKKNNTVCIYAEGLAYKMDLLKENKIEYDQEKLKKMQTLDVKRFIAQMTYINDNETRYTGFAVLDHHMRMLPNWGIKFVFKQMASYIYNDLLKKIKDFDKSVWEKQRKENYEANRYFYDWIQDQMNQWKKQKQQKNQLSK